MAVRGASGGTTNNYSITGTGGYLTAASFGLKGDGTTDDTANFQTAVNAGVSTGYPLLLEGGKAYKISSLVTANLLTGTNSFSMMSTGPVNAVIEMASGNSASLFQVSGNGSRFGGRIQNIWFKGSTASGSTTGQTGLILNGVPQYVVSQCVFDYVDMGLWTQNNCYGCSFYDLATFTTTCNVGMYLQGQNVNNNAGSGSDICLFSPWLSGRLAGIWMGPNQGGFHLYGGQIGANNQGGGAANDMCAGIHAGLTYIGQPDTTVATNASAGSTSLVVTNAAALFAAPGTCQVDGSIVTYSGVSGNTLTGIPASGYGSLATSVVAGDAVVLVGGVNSVGLHGCSFEGSDYSWAIRMNGGIGWSMDEVNFNANHANHAIGVFKNASQYGLTSASFRDCNIQGNFSNASLIVAPDSKINETGTCGSGTANGVSFTFLGSGNACTQSSVANGLPLPFNSQNFSASGTISTGITTALATSSGCTLTLPPVASYIGQSLTIKNMFGGAGTTTLNPNGSEQIDGSNSNYPVTQTSVRNTITLLGVNVSSLNQWVVDARISG